MQPNKGSLPQAFRNGVQAFNHQKFYEAHEHFETAWRQTPGNEREFFRAFLHLSGGFFRLSQDRPAAARKFFVHAQKWLAYFPEHFRGYLVTEILHDIDELILAIDQKQPPSQILMKLHKPIQPEKDHQI